jgi:DNA invertase Pin-like site-specific DNA recombinase
MKAFSYLRVSGKSQISGDGFDRQRETIARRCQIGGIKIVRPALSALFAAILDEGVRVVIVERSDRFSRDLMVGEVLLAKFRDIGVTVLEAEDGRDITANDPDNATATLIRHVLAAVAQFDKAGIVSKLRKARARKRDETGRCEGIKPFGALPGELESLARMRALRRKREGKHLSFAKIARTLNEEGFPTRNGGQWVASSVRDILGRGK